MNDEKESLYRNLKDEAFVIPPPLVRVLAQVLFSIKRSLLKIYLSDILNLTIFSPKETVML